MGVKQCLHRKKKIGDIRPNQTQTEKEWLNIFSERAKAGGEDYQIARWTREGLETYIKYFFVYFRSHIQKDNSQTLILDLGCGPGTFSRLLAQKGFLVHAVDYCPEVIKIAKERTINEKINYQVGDIYNLPFPDGFFDIIICLGVFQTISHPRQAIEEIESKLKPKGLLIITALNSFSIFQFFTRDKQVKASRFSPYTFKKILNKDNHFERVKLKGIFFPLFVLKSKVYVFFNLFFPLFNFLSHSFYIEARKS